MKFRRTAVLGLAPILAASGVAEAQEAPEPTSLLDPTRSRVG